MAALGLVLLAFVGVTLVLTGLPAYAVLILAAVLGAAAAVATGSVPLALLGALPGRLINLLESDLLQALPLYVLMGVLLNRLTVAPAVFRTLLGLLPRRAGAPVVAGLGLGALLGPMSGSVGASVLALARAVEPGLKAAGLPTPLRHATIAVASTLGVVIPPSLVLILLGDAMLSAHTFAVNATGRVDRVINTQDVLRAAIVPAALFLLPSLAVGWYSANRDKAGAAAGTDLGRRAWRDAILTAATVTFLVLLLGGVAAGYIFAVEGAATGAFVLFTAGVLTRQINGKSLGPMLTESMATTGTLFAPLLAATTFTLVLRLLGTDKLIERWVAALPGGDIVVAGAILGAIFVAGIAILSGMQSHAVRGVLAKNESRLSQYGVSAERILQEVAIARARGFAVRTRALTPGASAVSVTICSFGGAAHGALTITPISRRLSPKRTDEIVAKLRMRAEAIESELRNGAISPVGTQLAGRRNP